MLQVSTTKPCEMNINGTIVKKIQRSDLCLHLLQCLQWYLSLIQIKPNWHASQQIH